MYHPYAQFNEHQTHPYSLYQQSPCNKMKGKPFDVCRDDAFRRHRRDQNTVGYQPVDPDQSSELARWEPFTYAENRECSPCTAVEKFSMGTTLRTTAGLKQLCKDDFQVLRDGNLLLHDRRFANKTAFVIFLINDCPECQDTKTMWEAHAIEAHYLIGGGEMLSADKIKRLCTKRIQSIMFKRRDGLLVEYNGPFNVVAFRSLMLKHGMRA